jgi:hypothetical protein
MNAVDKVCIFLTLAIIGFFAIVALDDLIRNPTPTNVTYVVAIVTFILWANS